MRKLKRRATGAVLSVVFILFAFAAGFFVALSMSASPAEEPRVVTVDLEGTINNIGELATAEYGYKITQTTEKPAKELAGIRLPFTSSRVMYSYEGMVKAGINFQDVKVRVSEANHTIYVQLPNIRILSSEVDNNSLIVYDEKYSPFNTFTFADFNLSQADLKQAGETAALVSGLMERAKENAKALILTSIGSFYDLNEYEVIFT